LTFINLRSRQELKLAPDGVGRDGALAASSRLAQGNFSGRTAMATLGVDLKADQRAAAR